MQQDAALPSRHDTKARAQFAADFSAAVRMISKLEQRGTAWRVPKKKKALKDMDLNGQQTTNQLSFSAPDPEGRKLFAPGMAYRRRKDDESDYWESYFKFKNATKQS